MCLCLHVFPCVCVDDTYVCVWCIYICACVYSAHVWVYVWMFYIVWEKYLCNWLELCTKGLSYSPDIFIFCTWNISIIFDCVSRINICTWTKSKLLITSWGFWSLKFLPKMRVRLLDNLLACEDILGLAYSPTCSLQFCRAWVKGIALCCQFFWAGGAWPTLWSESLYIFFFTSSL